MTREDDTRADHVVADQSEVASFLADPATHGGHEVQRLDTHGAMVFLAGERAYKVKRAVDFPYMDFSTLARRRAVALREVRLNRRTAPDLYLGVAPILRGEDGGLRLGDISDEAPDGEDPALVEWVVVMRRFPQENLFDRMAEEGRLSDALIEALAGEVRRFHDAAEVIEPGPDEASGSARIAAVIDENAEEFAERPELFAPETVREYLAAVRAAWRAVAPLLDARMAGGFVRRCHGDLHLRNVCLMDGRPTLFDAIEFNDAIACIDVLYDLAFLLMDLDRRGLREQSNRVLNRYLRGPEDLRGLAALPCFLSCRAAIRAKVAASAEASQRQAEARARLHREAGTTFAAAMDYLAAAPTQLVAVGGLSGTGKSSLARRLAPRIGRAPGAVVLRSDVERKRLMGMAEDERLDPAAYTREVSARVYRRLADLAGEALSAGQCAVVDAVYAAPAERAAIEAVARERGAGFLGLWLEAPLEVLLGRVRGRRGDASDATEDVVRQQSRYSLGTLNWRRLDAQVSLDALAAAAAAELPEAVTAPD